MGENPQEKAHKVPFLVYFLVREFHNKGAFWCVSIQAVSLRLPEKEFINRVCTNDKKLL
jgi:hypothetical protein